MRRDGETFVTVTERWYGDRGYRKVGNLPWEPIETFGMPRPFLMLREPLGRFPWETFTEWVLRWLESRGL